jgi:hypothetical protein
MNWLLETGGKMVAGMAATLAYKWLDDRFRLQARVMYCWQTWHTRLERPKGYAVCPVCYGKGSYKDNPLCSYCHDAMLPSTHRGFIARARRDQTWDRLWWKPNEGWVGHRLSAPLPDGYAEQFFSPREQRAYRESLKAPRNEWRTPPMAS